MRAVEVDLPEARAGVPAGAPVRRLAPEAAEAARARFTAEVARFLERFNVIRAAILARLLEDAAAYLDGRAAAARAVLGEFKSALEGAEPAPREGSTATPAAAGTA